MRSDRTPKSPKPGRRAGAWAMSAAAVAGVLLASACSSSSSSTSSGSAAASSTAASSAAGVDTAAAALLPASIKGSGVLNDGVNLPNPPLEYQANGAYTGFDVDLARALAAKLGLKVNFDSLAFTALLTSLDTGRVDIVLSGLFDTPLRAQKYTIINYLDTGAQIFTLTKNASKAPSLASLCGQTVETAVGTAFIQQLKTLSTTLCADKAPLNVLAVGGSFAEEVLQISTGRAVAAVATPDNIAYSLTTSPNTYVRVGHYFDPVPYGIDVVKSNTGLTKALAAALKDILADGTYAKIAAKYNLQASGLTSVVVKGGA